MPRGVALADAGHGADMTFQAHLDEFGLDHMLGVQPRAEIWTDGQPPLPPETWSGPRTCSKQGLPPGNRRCSADHQPAEAEP